jgi:hypothetical protein
MNRSDFKITNYLFILDYPVIAVFSLLLSIIFVLAGNQYATIVEHQFSLMVWLKGLV